MPEKEMWNIFPMVSHMINLMDKAETPENEELFEKIRWALDEQEHTIITLSNCIESMKEAHLTFSENFFSAMEEINQRYNKPKEAQ
jgi:vacuolar-type H+-ATPase subunit D/Vma8